MGVVNLPKTLTEETEAKATDVMADLNAIVAQMNGQLDGENLAESIRNALIPIGTVLATVRSSAPEGFLLCQGQEVSRTTYAALFAAMGTTYGAGNGTTTFNLPDFRGRVPVGVEAGSGRLTPQPGAQGQAGGSSILQTHAHGAGSLVTSDENTVHSHQLGWFGNIRHEGTGIAYNTVDVGGSTNTTGQNVFHKHTISGSTAAEGGGGSGNMQPYQVVQWMVRI